MHDLLRILLNDLPSTPEGFPSDQRERWLDAWVATVRYVYVGDQSARADTRQTESSASSIQTGIGTEEDTETSTTPTIGVVELDELGPWTRPARNGPESSTDALGPPEPAPPSRASAEPASPVRNSAEAALPAHGSPSAQLPGRGGTDAPLPVRGAGSSSGPHSYGSPDPSSQPWYGFGADQSGPAGERPDRVERGERAERGERGERSGRGERATDRGERPDRGEPLERVSAGPSAPAPAPLPPTPPPRSRAWTVEDDARLVQRFRAGFSPEQLADLFGRSSSAVRERLMQLGVDRRSP
jgi:hypothetical protein